MKLNICLRIWMASFTPLRKVLPSRSSTLVLSQSMAWLVFTWCWLTTESLSTSCSCILVIMFLWIIYKERQFTQFYSSLWYSLNLLFMHYQYFVITVLLNRHLCFGRVLFIKFSLISFCIANDFVQLGYFSEMMEPTP